MSAPRLRVVPSNLRELVDPERIRDMVVSQPVPLRLVAKITALNERSRELSPRETQVLSYYAHGLTERQVATILGISVETVRTHRRRLMRKLEAETIAHAVLLYLTSEREAA